MATQQLFNNFSLTVSSKDGFIYEELPNRGGDITITWKKISGFKNTPTLHVVGADRNPAFNYIRDDKTESSIMFSVKPDNANELTIRLEFSPTTIWEQIIKVQAPPIIFRLDEKNLTVGRKHCITITGARLPKDGKFTICGLEDSAVEKQYWINEGEMRLHFRVLQTGTFNLHLRYDDQTISNDVDGNPLTISVVGSGIQLPSFLGLGIALAIPVLGYFLFLIAKLTGN